MAVCRLPVSWQIFGSNQSMGFWYGDYHLIPSEMATIHYNFIPYCNVMQLQVLEEAKLFYEIHPE
jgi:hypothetical protein